MRALKKRHPVDAFHHEMNKPVEDIQMLIRHLSVDCNKSLTQKRKSLNFVKGQENQCLLLFKGSVALYRSSDGIILNSESAPFIFGLGSQVSTSQHLYLRTQEDSLIGLLPFAQARQIIRAQNLWENLSNLLIYNANKIYSHCIAISQLSSYEIIKRQLIQLDSEPTAIKQNITAANYILSRTFLSRSGVMRILSRLKADGHIVAERGILLHINHLP